LITAFVSAVDYYRRFHQAFLRSSKVTDIAEARAARRTEYAAQPDRKIAR
jgi:hypothetical protein